MTLLQPIWLLLCIPLGVSLWVWKPSSRLLWIFRVVILSLVLLAMCGLAVELPRRAGTIVVIADRSLSMPPGSEARQKEAIDLIQSEMPSDSRLGVVSFGRVSAVEQSPQSGKFAGFVNEVNGDASDLNAAVAQAIALIPRDSPGRVILLSDGRWTGNDPMGTAAHAAARGIPIDYRAMRRDSVNDVAISHVDAPDVATPGESFMIAAWIHAPISGEISYELLRNNQRLTAGKRSVPSGLSRLIFRDKAAQPGTHQYAVRIGGSESDPVPENNTAKVLVGIQGSRPILHITSTSNSGLSNLLKAGGLDVETAPPSAYIWSIDELSGFSAVLIENVLAGEIGFHGMDNLAAWVRETGSGFMMTGGKHAYGPGGYFKSPLEPIMPLSMELRREHRKLSLAIVVAMDRSGSMSMPVGGGRTKIDLANLATAEVFDMLSPTDEFGVIAVDSAPHIIANLAPVDKLGGTRSRILRIASQGGGIFVYEALSAASSMLLRAQAGTRHIILFADAADSEQPGRYIELLDECRKANITVSVVGLGTPSDVDAKLLRDIARRGEGRCFFTEDAQELPRLFAQDTFVVARSTFVDEPTPIKTTGGMAALTGTQYQIPSSIGGYNLCYIRPDANLAAVTLDEYNAPVVAAWQAGTGRVLCYTGEADGAHTGAIANWNGIGNLFTSLARWTAGDSANLPDGMLLTQKVRNGVGKIQLHLDPEREGEMFRALPSVTILRGVVGEAPTVSKTKLSWTSADSLTADVPIHGGETALASVEVPGAGTVSLPPICLPYSPEFKPAPDESGLATMERLSKTSGGKSRVSLGGIWDDLPRNPRLIGLAPWLLIAALILLLLETLERRTGLFSMKRAYRVAAAVTQRIPRKARRTSRTLSSSVKTSPPTEPEHAESPHTTPEPEASVERGGMLDALTQARRRASGRTGR
ncbi:MAG: VWA domain-containing protein [Candidatus Poribacteria bacterium]|nr:VWA domain-containing protein [Candidatus Poribacteria bacterium]